MFPKPKGEHLVLSESFHINRTDSVDVLVVTMRRRKRRKKSPKQSQRQARKRAKRKQTMKMQAKKSLNQRNADASPRLLQMKVPRKPSPLLLRRERKKIPLNKKPLHLRRSESARKLAKQLKKQLRNQPSEDSM
jgi:hypothetical protein